ERTDLALEASDMREKSQEGSSIPGVKIETKELENCIVTKVEVIDRQGAEIMNKVIGKYITLARNLMKFVDDQSSEVMISYLK
ncbi:GPR endopeptidase, partial [Clostridioides difficile]|uniref:GPR endopeptidase n=1 Tax=Clostridioides difficile TaxID=1496 RepID=UPI002ED0541C